MNSIIFQCRCGELTDGKGNQLAEDRWRKLMDIILRYYDDWDTIICPHIHNDLCPTCRIRNESAASAGYQ